MTGADPVANYGRVRRLASRYCWGVERQIERLRQSEDEMFRESDEGRLGYAHYTNKNDWEVVLVFLTRLRRCLALLEKLAPNLSLDTTFVERFEKLIPSLKDIRDYEEHFDDYALGIGKNKNAVWGYLESYEFGAKRFSNGLGELTAEGARSASLIVWEAVMSLENQAVKLGYLTWDARYGHQGKFRSAQ